jgi:hypothetical protein
VANPLPLVAPASVDLVWDATLSMSSEDPDHPVENIQTSDPALLAKSLTNTTTIGITTPLATPVAIALIQTNAESASLNGNPIPIPATELDGQRIHAWLNMSTSPIASGTSWNLTLSRASGVVFIGRVVLVTALYALPLKYGLETGRNRPGATESRTRLGSLNRVSAGIRTRWARGAVDIIEAETLMRDLEASAQGMQIPFLFIPDENVNDAWFVTYVANDFRVQYPNYDVRDVAFAVEEVSNGPVNG